MRTTLPRSVRDVEPSAVLLDALRRAFHKFGFAKLTMVEIARECGFTRRALYHYFSSKEEAFRALIRHDNDRLVRAGFAAGDLVRREGGEVVDIVARIMDVRYGETRRVVETSPHTVELNAVAFMLCRDIMIEAAVAFQRELADLIAALTREGRLKRRDDFSFADIAQTLANGARGVNQALPPASLDELARRYRLMCQAVLFGCATRATADQSLPSGRTGIVVNR